MWSLNKYRWTNLQNVSLNKNTNLPNISRCRREFETKTRFQGKWEPWQKRFQKYLAEPSSWRSTQKFKRMQHNFSLSWYQCQNCHDDHHNHHDNGIVIIFIIIDHCFLDHHLMISLSCLTREYGWRSRSWRSSRTPARRRSTWPPGWQSPPRPSGIWGPFQVQCSAFQCQAPVPEIAWRKGMFLCW